MQSGMLQHSKLAIIFAYYFLIIIMTIGSEQISEVEQEQLSPHFLDVRN